MFGWRKLAMAFGRNDPPRHDHDDETKFRLVVEINAAQYEALNTTLKRIDARLTDIDNRLSQLEKDKLDKAELKAVTASLKEHADSLRKSFPPNQ